MLKNVLVLSCRLRSQLSLKSVQNDYRLSHEIAQTDLLHGWLDGIAGMG
jgi:hypothetical protein